MAHQPRTHKNKQKQERRKERKSKGDINRDGNFECHPLCYAASPLPLFLPIGNVPDLNLLSFAYMGLSKLIPTLACLCRSIQSTKRRWRLATATRHPPPLLRAWACGVCRVCVCVCVCVMIRRCFWSAPSPRPCSLVLNPHLHSPHSRR